MPSEGSGSSGSGHSHSASPDVVLLQGDDEDTTAGGEEDAGHLEDRDALSQGTVSLLNISTSDNEDTHKATVQEAACMSDVQYGNWWDEKIHQGSKALPGVTRGSMIMPMVEGLARLWTRSDPLFPTWKSMGCSNPWIL